MQRTSSLQTRDWAHIDSSGSSYADLVRLRTDTIPRRRFSPSIFFPALPSIVAELYKRPNPIFYYFVSEQRRKNHWRHGEYTVLRIFLFDKTRPCVLCIALVHVYCLCRCVRVREWKVYTGLYLSRVLRITANYLNSLEKKRYLPFFSLSNQYNYKSSVLHWWMITFLLFIVYNYYIRYNKTTTIVNWLITSRNSNIIIHVRYSLTTFDEATSPHRGIR